MKLSASDVPIFKVTASRSAKISGLIFTPPPRSASAVSPTPAVRLLAEMLTGGLVSISANNLTAGVGLTAEADLGGGVKINPLIFADLDAVTLKIGTSDADSFIGNLLSGAQIQGQFN